MKSPGHALPRMFFHRPVPDVARDLIGATLLVGGVGGTVVETEAYARDDPASHSFGGRTTRNASMFGPTGHAYVYRSYGVHWCLNAVCDAEALGSAVLVRALEPTVGIELMRERRGVADLRRLCSGPGRLCQALGVTGALDRLPLDAPPFVFEGRSEPMRIAEGRRIGITRAAETPWRFCLSSSEFLSRPLRG